MSVFGVEIRLLACRLVPKGLMLFAEVPSLFYVLIHALVFFFHLLCPPPLLNHVLFNEGCSAWSQALYMLTLGWKITQSLYDFPGVPNRLAGFDEGT